MKRFQSRRGNGRFQRNTLANTFGLKAPVCAECNSFNTHGIDEPPPDKCHACGSALREGQEGKVPKSESAAGTPRACETCGDRGGHWNFGDWVRCPNGCTGGR